MLHIEPRVAIVEARMAEQSHVFESLREGLRHCELRVDRRFEKIDERFGQVEARLTTLDQKFDTALAATIKPSTSGRRPSTGGLMLSRPRLPHCGPT